MKNIIFCADGTWNSPGQDDNHDGAPDPTNVFKLFSNLDGSNDAASLRLADEQERTLCDEDGAAIQIGKYLHGVGDSDNLLVKLLGGTMGAGLITRIVRGYTFISRNYSPGDKIFITGFSRGAYTARALAGFISAKGLLDPARVDLNDKGSAYRQGAAVWYDYRKTAIVNNRDWLRKLEDMVADLPAFVSRPSPDVLLKDVPIEAVGVWDTVGALGIPEYNAKRQRLDAFRFVDTTLSANVRHAYHAVAIDEQREDFTPTLWKADPRIAQLLFPGAHADVGGGYPMANNESGLSDAALAWMTNQLSRLGVRFADKPAYPPSSDPRGTAHQPWAHEPWDLLPKAARSFPPQGLTLDDSVCARIAGGALCADPGQMPCAYDPKNIAAYRAAAGCT